ncbi:dipeptidase D [Dysgonomonas sp. PH5-45]|uniref:aminoacyl-histidine dipeptidase n=1 Tax=unclassified Dysgonomonas TaxID=2630389 RepID=UPI0024757FA3|nr:MULTISPECIES: aminoacyl-histidine dipeptidase [unclassified Dysgonomonas]MDH6355777.1 dipeptidase D [Dysgonomonas sp. PH5-45]MDH6388662.1 dipeptidase D [Dysgonomonas sp. PH5-37]
MSKEILNLKPENVWKHFYDLTLIPRPTGQMDEVVKFVADFGKSLGLETRVDEVGNVVITKPASAGMENAPTVILQGHLDMVPQKNSDVKHDFAKDPIDAYIDGDKVKARSTTLGADNGIGAAAIMAVLEDKSLVHGKIEGLFTTDEEVGMVGAFGLKPGFLTGSILLNLDTEDEGELCVGCAGGADVDISFQYKDVEVPEGESAIKVSLTGLKGGHSGCEIHLGRANANKLMFRFLKEAVRDYEARLSFIDGGSLRNAIPREAFAIITVPAGSEQEVIDLVASYNDLFAVEFASTEGSIIFKAEKTDLPKTLFPEEIQDDLINAIIGAPNGVQSMLTDFPGTVEASTSLASVKSQPGLTEVKFLSRSSSESKKEAVCSSIESVFELAGAKVEIVNPYPGWQPNIKSKTLAVMKKVYKDLYGNEPVVQVVHAGLECGIILDSTPGLDIVSFGPTIMNPHSPDEYVDIATVGKFYDYLIATLANLK